MLQNLKELKILRRKLGINQAELARIAGVSQSLIAKIESDKIDPSYTNVTKIFRAIESFEREKQVMAENVMNKKMISLKPENNIGQAICVMKKHAISQIPIISENSVVGLVTESDLIAAKNLQNDKIQGNAVGLMQLEKIMQPAPPIVAGDTRIAAVSAFLKHFPMVIVAQKGKIAGVITKADILRTL